MDQTKWGIVNYLIDKYKYKYYLEISTPTTGCQYDLVKRTDITKEILYYLGNPIQTDHKRTDIDNTLICIDYELGLKKLLRSKYDIIFVDPYHSFEQSKKDIETAYNLLDDNGIIVIHDCCPETELITSPKMVSGTYVEGSWFGLTYKAFIDFNQNNPMVQTYVVECDHGCGIIIKNRRRKTLYTLPTNLTLNDVSDINYFTKNKKILVNLISVDEFLNLV